MTVSQKEVWDENKHAHDVYLTAHDQIASHIAKPWCRQFYQTLLRQILVTHGMDVRGRRVLEFGCGTGNWAEHFMQAGAASYHGLDISAGMVAAARRKVTDPRAGFFCLPVEAVEGNPELARSYDLIFSFSFIHHLYALPDFFQRVAGLLAPGASYIALHEPLLRDVPSEKRNLGEILDELGASLAGWDRPSQPFYRRLRDTAALIGSKFHKARSPALDHGEAGEDKIDFQLSLGDFSPSKIHAATAGLGLVCRSRLYSYYRSRILRQCFGATRNYFAVIVTRLP